MKKVLEDVYYIFKLRNTGKAKLDGFTLFLRPDGGICIDSERGTSDYHRWQIIPDEYYDKDKEKIKSAYLRCKGNGKYIGSHKNHADKMPAKKELSKAEPVLYFDEDGNAKNMFKWGKWRAINGIWSNLTIDVNHLGWDIEIADLDLEITFEELEFIDKNPSEHNDGLDVVDAVTATTFSNVGGTETAYFNFAHTFKRTDTFEYGFTQSLGLGTKLTAKAGVAGIGELEAEVSVNAQFESNKTIVEQKEHLYELNAQIPVPAGKKVTVKAEVDVEPKPEYPYKANFMARASADTVGIDNFLKKSDINKLLRARGYNGATLDKGSAKTSYYGSLKGILRGNFGMKSSIIVTTDDGVSDVHKTVHPKIEKEE